MIITATAFAGVGTLVTALLHVEMRQEHASKLAVRVMDVLMGAAIAAPVCVMLALG